MGKPLYQEIVDGLQIKRDLIERRGETIYEMVLKAADKLRKEKSEQQLVTISGITYLVNLGTSIIFTESRQDLREVRSKLRREHPEIQNDEDAEAMITMAGLHYALTNPELVGMFEARGKRKDLDYSHRRLDKSNWCLSRKMFELLGLERRVA